MMKRRRLLLALGAGLIAPGIEAQPKVRRIGYLTPHALIEPPTPERAGFLAGLRELGYQPGRNLIIEYRAGDSDFDRLPDLAAELVKLRVELIVAISGEATIAVKAINPTMPMVTVSGDPVQQGLIKSYARPGGTITGMSFIAPELGAKRVALAKEIAPQARRIAVIWNARDSIANNGWSAMRGAARTLELAVDPMPMAEADEVRAGIEPQDGEGHRHRDSPSSACQGGRGDPVKRRCFLIAAGGLVAPISLRAQPASIPRIGVLIHSGSYMQVAEGLRAGLKENGIREGKDAALEVVDAKADIKLIEDAARRFERDNVRLIYCTP